MSKRLLRIKRFIHSSSLYRLSFSSSVFVPSREEEEEEEENDDDGNETPFISVNNKVVFLSSVRSACVGTTKERKRERAYYNLWTCLYYPRCGIIIFIIGRVCSSTQRRLKRDDAKQGGANDDDERGRTRDASIWGEVRRTETTWGRAVWSTTPKPLWAV